MVYFILEGVRRIRPPASSCDCNERSSIAALRGSLHTSLLIRVFKIKYTYVLAWISLWLA